MLLSTYFEGDEGDVQISASSSGHFTGFIRDSSFRNYPDFFKFGSFDTKKFRHLDDLMRTDEIRRLGTELIYPGGKLAALHCLRDIQTKTAGTLWGAKQAKVANDHFISPPVLVYSYTSVTFGPRCQTEVIPLHAGWLSCAIHQFE